MKNFRGKVKIKVIPKINSWRHESEAVTVLYNGKNIVGVLFGSSTYSHNVAEIGKLEIEECRLIRPATTAESIALSSYDFGKKGEFDAKRDIYDLRWLQAGSIVKAGDGVYINSASAVKEGNVDEQILGKLRDDAKSSNGIRLGDNGFAFVPYEKVEQGYLGARKFAEGGLARGLEHAQGNVAEKLLEIASTYSNGVNVDFFDKSEKPISRVVTLYSDAGSLQVIGDYLNQGNAGYSLGVPVTLAEIK